MTNVFMTLVDVVDGDQGQKGLLTTVLWREKLWLAAGRRPGGSVGNYLPARIVRPHLFQFEEPDLPQRGEDYSLACAIPKAVLDGRALLEESKRFEIVEAPAVEIPLSTLP